jgi:hypothetical protein
MDRGQDKSALREELNSQFNDPSFTTIQIASKQILVTGDLATVTVTFTDNSTQTLTSRKKAKAGSFTEIRKNTKSMPTPCTSITDTMSISLFPTKIGI